MKIKVLFEDRCPTCSGQGKFKFWKSPTGEQLAKPRYEKCPKCNGTGQEQGQKEQLAKTSGPGPKEDGPGLFVASPTGAGQGNWSPSSKTRPYEAKNYDDALEKAYYNWSNQYGKKDNVAQGAWSIKRVKPEGYLKKNTFLRPKDGSKKKSYEEFRDGLS